MKSRHIALKAEIMTFDETILVHVLKKALFNV